MTNNTGKTAKTDLGITLGNAANRDKNRELWLYIENLTRKMDVNDTVTDPVTRGSRTIHLGKLSELVTIRAKKGEGFGDVPGWSDKAHAEGESMLYSLVHERTFGPLRDLIEHLYGDVDGDGEGPWGSGALFYFIKRGKASDKTTKARSAEAKYREHCDTDLPDDLTTEKLGEWTDTLSMLNAKRRNPTDEDQLILDTIDAFPASLSNQLETRYHVLQNDILASDTPLADMTDEWGSVLDSINNKKKKADKAARAMAAQEPAPAAAPAPTSPA